ncbi:MAG: hypothetical protein R2789_07930 [Microthrixaceae bacterium]
MRASVATSTCSPTNTNSAGNSYGCHENFLTTRTDELVGARGADPVPGQQTDLRRRRQGSSTPHVVRSSPSPNGPNTSGKGFLGHGAIRPIINTVTSPAVPIATDGST